MWGLLLCVGMAVPLCLSAQADADLWWHILSGRSILADRALPTVDSWSYTFAGAPWTNHEWLADVVLAVCWDWGGTLGLLTLRALLVLVFTVSLGIAVWRRWPHPLALVFLVGVTLPMNAALINLRPQAFSYVFVALSLALLECVRSGRRWPFVALPFLFALWANLHAGFVFGAGLVALGLVLIPRGWDGTPALSPTHQRHALLALAATFGAVCLTPHGFELLRYIVTEMGAPHPYLPEWNPPEGAMVPLVFLGVAVPAGLAAVARERLRPTEWIGLAVAFVITLRSQKFIILVLMLGALSIASSLGALWRRHSGRWGAWAAFSRHWASALLFAAAIVAGGRAFWGPPGRIPVSPGVYPTGAMAWLRESMGTGRLWCPLGWGGYALYHLGDRYKVAIDGRNTTVYPVSFVVEQTEALYAGQLEPIERLAPDVILTYGSGPLFEALERAGSYERHYGDATSAVFVRRGAGFTPAPQTPPSRLDFPG